MESQVPNVTLEPLALSIADACKRLSVGRSSIYELLQAKRIRAIKVGTRTLIPEVELRRFVADELARQE